MENILISQNNLYVTSTRYKFFFSVPSSNNFASFLFEKQYAHIYQVVAWCSFLARNNRKYLKIDYYVNHSSTLPIHASVTIT